jgi:exopolysaccharide biosynthesis polyprenyl glycosylphosphotransferase
MFSRHHRKAKLLFALADIVLGAVAFEAAYRLRAWLPFERLFYLTVPNKALLVGAITVLWPLLGYWLGVYARLDSAHPLVVLRDSFKQSATGTVGVILIQYAVHLNQDGMELNLSRPFVALFATFSWLLLCLFRLNAGVLVGWIRREFGALHYVLVTGLGEPAQRLGRCLEMSGRHGIRLVGFVADHSGETRKTISLDKEYPVYPLAALPSLLERLVIDEVIFAVDSERLSELEDLMLLCEEDGVRTRVTLDFFPHVKSDVFLDHLSRIPLLTFAATPHDDVLLFLKRVIDVVVAGALLLALLPLMVVMIALIKLSSRGPAIFRQVRCGLNGRRFVVYKFRSMVANAEMLKGSVSHLNHKEVAFKIPGDPRLTPLGRYLRRFSLDELPQLWNVIRGDMSLVGPRPAVPEEVGQYKRWQRRRLRMRPGLTCLWAIEGRDELDFETWMRKDMEYIDTWSLALDWRILLLTIPRVLLGRGAH